MAKILVKWLSIYGVRLKYFRYGISMLEMT